MSKLNKNLSSTNFWVLIPIEAKYNFSEAKCNVRTCYLTAAKTISLSSYNILEAYRKAFPY